MWLMEIGKGLLDGLLNPIWLVGLLAVVVAGVIRVKRERRDLRVGIQPWSGELLSFGGTSLLYGLLLSVLLIGAGVVVSPEWIVVVSILILAFTITWQFRALSAAIYIPIAAALFLAVPYIPAELPLAELPASTVGATSVVLAGLLLVEGLLIRFHAWKKLSPRIIKTARGRKAGAFFTKRLWLVPVMLVVPSGSFDSFAAWWPLIPIGSTSWSLTLVPFLLGFQLTVVHTLPQTVIRGVGRSVIWLGALVLVLAVAGWFAPYAWLGALGVALIGRVVLMLHTRALCRHSGYYFMDPAQGVMIVDVLNGTPAEQMGLVSGELVKKVNGIPVHNVQELYHALQKNRAHCKLEVQGLNGEIRYTQRALHEGQHHQLGLIMVEERTERVS